MYISGLGSFDFYESECASECLYTGACVCVCVYGVYVYVYADVPMFSKIKKTDFPHFSKFAEETFLWRS